MKFKIGDKVRFMSEKGGGVVVKFSGKDTVHIEIEDGFEIPVKESEIFLANGNVTDKRTESKDILTTSGKSAPMQIDQLSRKPLKKKIEVHSRPVKLSLAFILRNPENPGGSEIDAFLINDSLYDFQFVINYEQQSVTYFHSNSLIEPEIQWHIGTYNHSELSKINALQIQGSFFSEGSYLPLSVVDSRINIQDVQFYKQKFYRETEYFEQKAVLFTLFSWKFNKEGSDKNEGLKAALSESKKFLMNKLGAIEIDLHIETLTKEYKDLSSSEILNIQLSRFRDAMYKAQNELWKQVVFIHGVGDGKLKFELRKILDSQFPDTSYQDASFQEYGYGATLVYFE